MAVAAPIVVFGFLYFLLVQPRAHLVPRSARERVWTRRAASGIAGVRSCEVRPHNVATASVLEAFEARTTEGDRVGEVVDGITAALKSPAVGWCVQLVHRDRRTGGCPARLDGRTVLATVCAYACDGDVRCSIRADWPIFLGPAGAAGDFRSPVRRAHAAAASRPAGLMRAKVSLLVFHRPGVTAPPRTALQPKPVEAGTAPAWTRDPFAETTPAGPRRVMPPAIARGARPGRDRHSGSLAGRRIALVDGRIVRPRRSPASWRRAVHRARCRGYRRTGRPDPAIRDRAAGHRNADRAEM